MVYWVLLKLLSNLKVRGPKRFVIKTHVQRSDEGRCIGRTSLFDQRFGTENPLSSVSLDTVTRGRTTKRRRGSVETDT